MAGRQGASRRPVIGIVGASQANPATLEAAFRLGRLVAEAGWILLTGGRPAGVMDAASAGAKSVPGSLTIGIMPSDPDGPVSAHVDIAIFTGLGDARNIVNVLSSDVVVACGIESAGTASEVALALNARRLTILLGVSPPGLAFFRTLPGATNLQEATTPEAAVAMIERHLVSRRG